MDQISEVFEGKRQWCVEQADNQRTWELLHRCDIDKGPVLSYLDPPFRTGMVQSGPAGHFDDPAVPMKDFTKQLVHVASSCGIVSAMRGSVVVHVDWKTVGHVRVALDEWFGVERFASEIVWRYRRWPSKTKNFQRVHDTLLRYVKDPRPGQATWNQLYEKASPSTLKTWGTKRQRAIVRNGKRAVSSVGEKESLGVPMGDVWDIPIIAPSAKERTGWPTQKPEALLKRLILATTNPGDLVLEPYLGSGTACAVAVRLGRRAIGIDINPQAVDVARKRMRNI